MTENAPFGPAQSLVHEPKLEFAFEVRLHFTRVQNIANMPTGARRGAVYVDSGEFPARICAGKPCRIAGEIIRFFAPMAYWHSTRATCFRKLTAR